MLRLSQARAGVVLIMAALVSTAVPYQAAAPAQADQKSDEQKKNNPAKTPVQVNGKVVDRSGKGLANADVTVLGASGAAAAKKTGADGTYSFELPPGAYTILAAKSGNKSDPRKFELTKKTDLPDLVVNTEH